MMTMWTALSDRDYYEYFNPPMDDEDEDRCMSCGAKWDQACEEWCDNWKSAPEQWCSDDRA